MFIFEAKFKLSWRIYHADIKKWMKGNKFSFVSDFKGTLSQVNVHNPCSYEKVQFIRLHSDYD